MNLAGIYYYSITMYYRNVFFRGRDIQNSECSLAIWGQLLPISLDPCADRAGADWDR